MTELGMSISGSQYLFDVFIAVDFSGSKDPRQQRKHIAFAETEHSLLTPRVEDELKFTRSDAVSHLMERLHYHDSRGKRVLCGFDFQYSFPTGFWHTLTSLQETWAEMTRGISEGVSGLPPISEEPESNARQWADAANKRISHRTGIAIGPFWGAHFSQATNPHFPFSQACFQEKRLVDQRVRNIHLKNIQPIFKIGGGGSVGLQSLCGIPYLSRIRADCSQQNVPLRFWPFDGWELTDYRHVLIEWYPAIHNRGTKSDKNDASACVRWAGERDEEGTLSHYFTPTISDSERAQSTFEGWILGAQ